MCSPATFNTIVRKTVLSIRQLCNLQVNKAKKRRNIIPAPSLPGIPSTQGHQVDRKLKETGAPNVQTAVANNVRKDTMHVRVSLRSFLA